MKNDNDDDDWGNNYGGSGLEAFYIMTLIIDMMILVYIFWSKING